MTKIRYAALFETGTKGRKFFRFAYLELPSVEYIPPPVLELCVPTKGLHTFAYAPDQSYLAKAFKTSQQNISRWLKNKEPES